MAQKNQIDMLNGPLLKKILLFSLPLAASSVLQQLFNSIDVAVVGRFVGREALAAVGANSPVISLLICRHFDGSQRHNLQSDRKRQ
jgi:Na+-driven multidrug efflux pump